MSLWRMHRTLFPEVRQALRTLEQEPFAPFAFPRFTALEPSFANARSPAMDVHEVENGYSVETELPGVDKKDLSLSFSEDGQTLTLRGKFERFNKAQDPAKTEAAPVEKPAEASTQPAETSQANATESVPAKAQQEQAVAEPLWQERVFGSFSRSFRFPAPVEGEKSTASLKDGILNVFVPRKTSSSAAHITIN